MKAIDHFVQYGPDTRHFIDTKMFYKRKDAKEFVESLPKTTAYKWTRQEMADSNSHGGYDKIDTVSERVI